MKRLYAYFYRTPLGREPVHEWLMGLDPEDRKTVGTAIKDVEFAWASEEALGGFFGSWALGSSQEYR